MELLVEMRVIAEQRGGNCLAKRYINSKEKLLWECSDGHRWLAAPFSIKVRKSWCPKCAGNQPLGISAMHTLAIKNGGKCVSYKYKNCKTKMFWQCKNGHQFQSTPENVKQGRWCPQCRNMVA